MVKEQLLAQAHTEARRRNVPVVQVLVEWLAPRMMFLPTEKDVERAVRRRERAEHPMQPVIRDDGVSRFKPNLVVAFLYDAAKRELGGFVEVNFHDDDRAQFAQLIGYRVDAFCDLSFVSEELSHEAQIEEDGNGCPRTTLRTIHP